MNRVLAHTGVGVPIVQAPMGWIARSQLASAVSNAGGLGVIETSSHEVLPVAEIIKRTVEGFHRIRREQGERTRAGSF
jgi:enoyl-[acyl-carrier protein] reductase II